MRPGGGFSSQIRIEERGEERPGGSFFVFPGLEPPLFERDFGEVPERSKGTDCKSVAEVLRRFESSPPHHMISAKEDCCIHALLGRE